MILQVESEPGLHGDIEPLAFQLGEARLQVLRIIDRWLGTDHSYFKIEASDGAIYILRHSVPTQDWELTLFQAPST